MPFIPNTDDDRARMLRKIGVSSFDELLESVPAGALNSGPLNLPDPLSEQELLQEFAELAEANDSPVCFAGGGSL